MDWLSVGGGISLGEHGGAAARRDWKPIAMKPAFVEKLETVLEQAMATALDSKKLKKLPVKPRRAITHLMAKAAAAVYEGVMEGREG